MTQALRLGAGKPDRLVEQRLVLHDAAGLEPAACREDQLWLGVVDAGRQLPGGKAAEHHAVHRADPRAGQHRHHRFRHHRHVENDAVALCDAEILHDGGERLHFPQQFGVGEFRDRVAERGIVDQRDLVGAAAGDMAIERVVAGVDHGAREPAAVGAERGVEDLLRRLDPVDLARRLGPKALGVGKRAGVDLVIPALFMDVHRRSPSPLSSRPDMDDPRMPGHDQDQIRPPFLETHCHGKRRRFKPKTRAPGTWSG